MKKTIAILIASGALLLSSPASQTFTGTITDDMCKGDHKSMAMGPDETCTKACVKGHGAKYALYDGKQVYVLSDQTTPEKFANKKVTVTGTLDGKTIKVDKIEAAK